MPKPLTGTIVWAGDHWKARVRMKDGSRPWVHLPPELSEAQARERAKRLARVAHERGVLKLTAGTTVNHPTETLAAWCERWLASREERGYTSVVDDRGRLTAHVFPLLGTRYVREITPAHMEDLVAHLDAKVRRGECSWKTARNVWGVVTKMFGDACRSKNRALRVREDNPCANVAAPDRGVHKIKVFLYPSEFLTLVSCEEVPLVFRQLFAVAVYLYARSGELRALRVEDIDLEHNTVHIHQSESQRRNVVKATKTGIGRRFALEPEILPLLRALVGDRTEGPLFEYMPTERNLARALRLYLARAGVKRRELFDDCETRKNLTFHDLRATGITWLAVRGDEPLKIKSRAGHQTFSTTEGYIREAEHVAPGFGTVFPKLPTALVDWSGIGPAAPPPSDDPPVDPDELLAERAGFEAIARQALTLIFASRRQRITIPGSKQVKRRAVSSSLAVAM